MEHVGFLRDLIILYGLAMAIALVMRRLRQPTLVGYLITGIVVGPFGLRLISDTALVEVLADLGVALLLFTIGLELSIKKLWRMRQLVVGAGSFQLVATVLLVFGVLFFSGVNVRAGVFWGFLAAASSTAIVMRYLQDRAELDTAHGQLIIGILLFQDLCVVPMMALLPALAAPGAGRAFQILWALLKSLGVVTLILLGARFLFPKLLRAIVLQRSRELFVIAVIFFALGTAWGASTLGLSLALGAFLAGIVLSESEYGHQVMAEILPFRDSFNSLFFISIGMLINLKFVGENVRLLLMITAAILFGKMLTGWLPTLAVGFPSRIAILVGLALCQVGEFSFVLLREGERLGLTSPFGYQLFLSAAVLTMVATPTLMQISPKIAQRFGGKSGLRHRKLGLDEKAEALHDHVIICGYGMNGRRMARMLRENHLPYVVIEMNARLVHSGKSEGEPIYYGDVSNPEILKYAGARKARAIVFAISDPAVLARAISQVRQLNPDVHIIARIKRMEDARELRKAGATDVIAEEVEAWMEIAVRTLRLYGMPREAVAEMMGTLREEDYEMARILPMPGQPLRHLWHLLPQVDIELFVVAPDSHLEKVDLRTLDLRSRTGGAVLAVVRGSQVIHNPPGTLQLEGGDQLVLIGSREQLAAAFQYLREPETRISPLANPPAQAT
jgi:CPA2 family monovalent cation:H+ antiporter-2